MFFLSTINLDCTDPQELAGFYQNMLGWERVADDPDWVKLLPKEGGTGLSFSQEPLFQRPTWPSRVDSQQMMIHLDIRVDDLETAGAHAIACGATLADFQPQEHVRVYLDPAGHPFCLWIVPPDDEA